MKVSVICIIVLATVIAVGLLGTSLAYAHSQPTQSYYGGGGYLSGQVLGFDYLNYLTPVAWAKVTATNGLYSLSTSTGGGGYYGYSRGHYGGGGLGIVGVVLVVLVVVALFGRPYLG